MGKALYSKSLGGVVSECSLVLHTQKAAFGAALLCQGDASLCPACVQPGALADGDGAGKSTRLPSRAICRAAVGSQEALMCASPLLGELRTGTVLGTSRETVIPSAL